MSAPSRPSARQVRRRRRIALALLGLVVIGVVYLALAATVFAPVDKHGSRLDHLTIHSRAVGRDLGVNVIVPPRAGPRGRALAAGLPARSWRLRGNLQRRGAAGPAEPARPAGAVVAFPAGGVHSYWHDRREGRLGNVRDARSHPAVVRRFGIDPHRSAIGGISMGGFGAYDIALKNPGRFCAVGGHSPALWFDGSETAPGAFEDAADFERNDVVAKVQSDPERLWRHPDLERLRQRRPVPRLRRRLRRSAEGRGRRPHRALMAGWPRRRLLE